STQSAPEPVPRAPDPESSIDRAARALPLDDIEKLVTSATVDIEHYIVEEDRLYWGDGNTNDYYTARDKAVLLGKTGTELVLLTTWCVVDPDAPHTDMDDPGDNEFIWDTRRVRIRSAGAPTTHPPLVDERPSGDHATGVLFVEAPWKPRFNLGLVHVKTDSPAGVRLAGHPSLGIEDPVGAVRRVVGGLEHLFGLRDRGGVRCPRLSAPPELDPGAPDRDFDIAGGAFMMALAATALHGRDVDPAFDSNDAVRRKVAEALLVRLALREAGTATVTTLGDLPPADRPYLLVASRSWLEDPRLGGKSKEYLAVDPRIWVSREEHGLLADEVRMWLSNTAPPPSTWYPVVDRATAERWFRFPAGAPADGGIYAASGEFPNAYIPVATYYDDVWAEKLRAFWACAASLGPSHVDLVQGSRTGTSAGGRADVDFVVVTAGGSARYESTRQVDQSVRTTYGAPAPGWRPDPVAECNRPELRQVRDDRMLRRLETVETQLTSSSTMSVSAAVHGRFKAWGLAVSPDFREYEERRWRFSARFWPLDDTGGVVIAEVQGR
ncbi:MAG: hypothetical protein JW940_10165, partial [Polyangiaceae bacterium]|nr:hypothetical protein [Polyangiaceae bacterium]